MPLLDRILPARANLRSRVEELEGHLRVAMEQRSIDSLPWNVGASVEGAVPTPTKALRLAPVYGAVSMIARSVASMPVHAYRSEGTERRRLPYLPQLFQHPSVHGELSDWVHRLMVSLLLRGNAYGLITQRDGYGFPVMVEWLDPDQVVVLDENMWGKGSFWDPIYYWRGRVIEKDNLVHIPWFSIPFRVKGLSPLSAFAAAVDLGKAGEKFTTDWYNAGGVPPGTFKNIAKTITEDEASLVKGKLVSAIRTHEPIVYGADWDFTAITISPKEAHFVEAHQMSATDIAVVYGIYPPERIGGVGGRSMTYANVEAEQIQWVAITLQPYVEKLERHFFQLMPQQQYVRFDMDSQIRSDMQTRHEIYHLDRLMGLTNIDELRQKEDMPPLPNGAGQDYTPLIAVRETIRAQQLTPGQEANEPGFKAGTPTKAGSKGGTEGTDKTSEPLASSVPSSNGSGKRSIEDLLERFAEARASGDDRSARYYLAQVQGRTEERSNKPGPTPPSSAYTGTSEEHLIHWFEHGEGAAEIGWGVPGDFDRCLSIAGRHMSPDKAQGFCANRHKSVTGFWPGHAPSEQHGLPDELPPRYRALWLRAESEEERADLVRRWREIAKRQATGREVETPPVASTGKR